MSRTLLLLPLSTLLLLACDPVGDDDATQVAGCSETIFDGVELLPELKTASGGVPDFSCCTPDSDMLCPNVPASSIISGTAKHVVDALVLDFSEDDLIEGAFVKVWSASAPGELVDPSTTPIMDTTGNPTNISGSVAIDDGAGTGIIQACVPWGYQVWTEFMPERTKITVESGVVLPPLPNPGDHWDATTNSDAELLSVSTLTYQLIPLALGINPRAGTGVAAGQVTDCTGEKVEGVQLVPVPQSYQYGDSLSDAFSEVMNSDGTCNDVFIRYFKNDTPDKDQLWSSDDGLYGGIDVPEGVWRMLIFAKLPGVTCPGINPDHPDVCPIAERTLNVQPDSVNVANVAAQQYPPACLL